VLTLCWYRRTNCTKGNINKNKGEEKWGKIRKRMEAKNKKVKEEKKWVKLKEQQGREKNKH
jgi:hypothetical protein